MPILPEDDLRTLPGVGPARASALAGLGLCRAEDLLRWFSHNCPELLQAIDGKMSGELQEALREQLRSFRETWEAGDTP